MQEIQAENSVIAAILALLLLFPLSAGALTWEERSGAAGFSGNHSSGGGALFSPVDFVAPSAFRGDAEEMPVSLDLRLLGRVSAVKNQGKFDTCWAFAALGSVESCLLKDGENINLSELYLAYYAYAGGDVREPGFSRAFPERNVLDQQGNDQKATAVMARWQGPVGESDAAYPAPPLYVIYDPERNLPARAHVQQVYSVPWRSSSQEARPQLQRLIRDYGGSTAHLYLPVEGYEGWFDEKEASYCYSGEEVSNHAVLLVGWDDTYSRERFKEVPPGDGAWIAKNSWGDDFGENGFFYVSYYDTALWSGGVYVPWGTASLHHVYQYDPLGCVIRMGFEAPEAEFANIFTAEQDELVCAAGFYTPVGNTSYSIRGCRGISGDLSTGTDLGVVASGELEFGGFHTLSLDRTFKVASGEHFALEVGLSTPDWDTPIPVEAPVEGYSAQASANPGESYVRKDSQEPWQDLTVLREGSNVCLKAYTRRESGPDPVPPASDGGGCNVGASSEMVLLGSVFLFLLLSRQK